MNIDQQISKLSQSLFIEIRKLVRIKPFLSKSAGKKIASAFILSRLDYCNSLLAGLPKKHFNKLQRIENITARVVTKIPIKDHNTTHALQFLHWLPVEARVIYKLACLLSSSLAFLDPCGA